MHRVLLLLLFAIVGLATGCAAQSYNIVYDQPMTTRAAPPALPLAKLEDIAHRIQFETNKATLLPESHSVLDLVATVLTKNPSAKLIEIQGHTDSSGNAEKNKTLSRQRAESVRTYLIDKGIAADRLKAAGYGSEKPKADNDTPEGRKKNRRVEFHILESAE